MVHAEDLGGAARQTAPRRAGDKFAGERESGTTPLEEAVEAYRAALQKLTRERVPLQWAMTQNNLGLAFQSLGERESDTTRLQEAAASFSNVLQVDPDNKRAYANCTVSLS